MHNKESRCEFFTCRIKRQVVLSASLLEELCVLVLLVVLPNVGQGVGTTKCLHKNCQSLKRHRGIGTCFMYAVAKSHRYFIVLSLPTVDSCPWSQHPNSLSTAAPSGSFNWFYHQPDSAYFHPPAIGRPTITIRFQLKSDTRAIHITSALLQVT